MMPTVELVKIFKQVSVRLDGTEVCVLPPRKEVTIDDVETAMQKVVDKIAGEEDEDEDW